MRRKQPVLGPFQKPRVGKPPQDIQDSLDIMSAQEVLTDSSQIIKT